MTNVTNGLINKGVKAPNLQGLPAILKLCNLVANLISSEMSILDHAGSLLTDVVDSRLVAGQLRLQGLVLLHQVLHTNQVTTCRWKVDNRK